MQDCKTPHGMMCEAARVAAQDAGVADPKKLLRDVVALGAPAMFLKLDGVHCSGRNPTKTILGLLQMK